MFLQGYEDEGGKKLDEDAVESPKNTGRMRGCLDSKTERCK